MYQNRRGGPNYPHTLWFESLESRQLLAADAGLAGNVASIDLANSVALAASGVQVEQQAEALAEVTAIRVSSSRWTPAFRRAIDPELHLGYSVPLAGPEQLAPLPWFALDQISATFSSHVEIGPSDLLLFGVNTPLNRTSAADDAFVYDNATHTATWKLASPLGSDKLLLVLAHGLCDLAVTPMAELSANTSPPNAVAVDALFRLRFNSLPGDATRSQLVAADDALTVIDKIISFPTLPAYSPFSDMNGNALIAADDALLTISRIVSFLPAAEPVPFGGDIAKFLVHASLDYFRPEFEIVDRASGYPQEGFNQRGFTQPTAIGFYAQLLANIATGEVRSEVVSSSSALERLEQLSESLLKDQADENLAFKGLLPWLGFDGDARIRANGPFGEQVALGDNVNLSASLGAAIGGLLQPSLAADDQARRIIANLEEFLDTQREGYEFLYDRDSRLFHRGWSLLEGTFIGDGALADYFGDEFRGGILFVALRFGIDPHVYRGLRLVEKDYTLASGETIYTISPFDGGAFQILWPTLTMPEVLQPGFRRMLGNFVDLALDFSARNSLCGFLSASYTGATDQDGMPIYDGAIGIQSIALNPPVTEDVASLYTLGAAHMVRPGEIDALLGRILLSHPGLLSEHGLWEGISAEGNVIEEQITTNVASFVLGMLGTGPGHMNRYVASQDLTDALSKAYQPGAPLDILANSDVIDFDAGVPGRAYRLDEPWSFSGRQLQIVYSTGGQDISLVALELKPPGSASPVLRLDNVVFQNTGDGRVELTIDLALHPILQEIQEVVFLFEGSAADRESLMFLEFALV